MAAALYLSDVLQVFYGPITEEENQNLPKALKPVVVASYFDVFRLAQIILENGFVFGEWMFKKNANNNDLLAFARVLTTKESISQPASKTS